MATATLDDFEKFERAWKATGPGMPPPDVFDFLPADLADCPHDLLLLFLEADIEQRIKSHRPAVLTQRYWENPRLSHLTVAQRLELIQFEWNQRRGGVGSWSATEYAEQFPELANYLPMLPRFTPNPEETPHGQARRTAIEDQPMPKVEGYTFLDRIGGGGMGVIWKARDLAFDRDVAIKILGDDYSANGSAAVRLLDEARITGQLQHPSIPAVHAVGKLEGGRPYFVMKLIKGRSLDKMIREKLKLNILAVFDQIAQAVGYAHAHGVIHRDLKPANVMVGAFGEVQVMDWGLAKVLGPNRPKETRSITVTRIVSQRNDEHATSYGSMLGTPAFAPPEQAVGEIEQMNQRSDVFGLGAILCMMLTGQPPYVGDDASVRLMAKRGHTEGAIERLAQCGGDPDLIELCLKCLQTEPEQRLASGAEVAAAAAKLRTEAEERARHAELDRVRAEVRVDEQKGRRRTQARLGGALLAALVLGGAAATWMAFDARREANRADAKAAEAEKLRILADEQKAIAVNAREEADASAEREKKRGDELERQKQLSDRLRTQGDSLVYATRIARSKRSWEEGRIDQAATELDNCRWDYLGWEHDYCYGLLGKDHLLLDPGGRDLACAAISPTGNFFVVADKDGIDTQGDKSLPDNLRSLHIYSVATGKKEITLPRKTGRVLAVAISPDGNTIAAAYNKEIILWTTVDWGERKLIRHNADITCLAFHPDRNVKFLYSGDKNGQLVQWNYQDAKAVKDFSNPSVSLGAIRAIVPLPEPDPPNPAARTCTRLAVATYDVAGKTTVISFWNARAGIHLNDLSSDGPDLAAMAASPDGAWLAAAQADGTVAFWNLRTDRYDRWLRVHAKGVNAIAFSPDSLRLATADSSGSLKIWDLTNRDALLAEFKSPTREKGPGFAFYSPDGERLFSGGGNALRCWDARAEATPAALLSHSNVAAFALAANSARLATLTDDGKLRARDLRGERDLGDFGTAEAPVAASPNGCWIAAARTGGGVLLHGLDGKHGSIAIPESERTTAIAFSPDGLHFAFAADGKPGDHRVHLRRLDAPSVKVAEFRNHTNTVIALAFSRDGKRLASASRDRTLRIADTAMKIDLGMLQDRSQYTDFTCVAFSPDGRRLATGADGEDKAVRLWDLDRRQCTARLAGHLKPVRCIAFSPDGRRLASGGDDQTLRLWNSETGDCLLELHGHTGPITAIAFRPDGRRIAAASRDEAGLVRTWEARNCLSSLRLESPLKPIVSTAFSHDGQHFFALEKDTNKIAAWKTRTGEPIENPEELTPPPADRWSAGRHESPDGFLILEPAGRELIVHFPDRLRLYRGYIQDELERWRDQAASWHWRRALECDRLGHKEAAAFHRALAREKPPGLDWW